MDLRPMAQSEMVGGYGGAKPDHDSCFGFKVDHVLNLDLDLEPDQLADCVLAKIKSHRDMARDGYWRFQIRPHRFIDLKDLLAQKLQAVHVRYSYLALACSLFVTVPSPKHDTFVGDMSTEIHFQLIRHKATPNVEALYASEHLLDDNCLEPDFAFVIGEEQAYPQLVGMAGDSQYQHDFRTLAHAWVHGSRGAVRTVLTFGLPYRADDKTATIFRWVMDPRQLHQGQPVFAFVRSDGQAFRHSDGTPVPGMLELRLSDVSKVTAQSGGDPVVVAIDYADMCKWLAKAERRAARLSSMAKKHNQKPRTASFTPSRLLPNKQPLLSNMTPRREARFVDTEKRVERKQLESEIVVLSSDED